ncbi:Crp/Fnr family transcriptional regulator [Parvibaculum sp.]|jgi:CRP-like cAMP-binding protein|uniref:Crp/Fnr family transcriptional regulator n=1 Tax=Parvibaculum sp. TaxID=2024848 RepID=UPI001B14D845|nr:Crp/Fnr family transcriptional regulator [Parvibaculum sp.]MBO6636246.1 Crp/Fnr family transcriptional regulator [Parvibaculum sp.]MBO6677854.1 Crp/Fnr family transcriptional regulator [Parvibaculum sp.]MBO6685465.1 Crp/Fnr family transcriptional regulator [Parvibaculum sp.]MBO6903829.1 Crp/Fnr family transcriptional regulator [Parvibaculum sp.]
MVPGAGSGRNAMTDGQARTLAGIGILAGLPQRELSLLAVECTWRAVAPNEILLNLMQGDTLGGVTFVVSGGVRLARSVGDGGRVIYTDVNAGGQFGERSIFGIAESDLTVVAREEGLVASLSEARFLDLLSREESVSRSLLCQYAKLLRDREVSGLRESAPAVEGTGAQRVYGELLALAEPHKNVDGREGLRIAKLPRHRELAARLDTTEEVVARAIADLVREGIAVRDYPGLIVGDRTALLSLCQPS